MQQGRSRKSVLAVVGMGLACVSLGIAYAGPAERGPASARASASAHPSLHRAPYKIDYELVDERLTRLAAEPEMVGFAVAIIENGEVSFLKGYGVTSAETNEPVTVRTVFRWASLSKGVAGTLVGMLADEGKLSLADPVAEYSSSLKLPGGAEKRVTVADVLSHRVGLYRNAFDNKLEAGQDPRVLRSSLATLKAVCKPGECHGYQNIAFDAASEVVERVTGKPYEQVAQERLFGPLGMKNASITREGLVNAPSWARPHVGRRVVPVTEAYYRVPAAGGVNSSIFDLAQWMKAQMGLAPGVIGSDVLNEIHRPRVATDRRRGDFNRSMTDSNYALGWRDYNYHGHDLVGHQGLVRGYRSVILFDPNAKAGVAILWNSLTSRPVGFQLEVLEMLYGLPRNDWLKLDGAAPPSTRVLTTATAR